MTPFTLSGIKVGKGVVMPQRKSAQEELKKSKKRHKLNLMRKRALKESIKTFRKALQNKNIEASKEALSKLYHTLDKAAAAKIIHSNKAARKKSRFTAHLNKSIASSSAIS